MRQCYITLIILCFLDIWLITNEIHRLVSIATILIFVMLLLTLIVYLSK